MKHPVCVYKLGGCVCLIKQKRATPSTFIWTTFLLGFQLGRVKEISIRKLLIDYKSMTEF